MGSVARDAQPLPVGQEIRRSIGKARAIVILLSSGLWISQGPGAECVGGLCLLRRPGSGFLVVGRLEHPVDSRPAAFEKALALALEDLPAGPVEPMEGDVCDWMWAPSRTPFLAQLAIWSRVRRYQPDWKVDEFGRLAAQPRYFDVLLRWQAGSQIPEAVGEYAERDYDLAWAQAARFSAKG